MIGNHYQINNPALLEPFKVVKDLFEKSYATFDGDVERFNGIQTNNFTMYPHKDGSIFVWKPGVLRKLQKTFFKVFNTEVYNIFILYTPAHGEYEWHSEGTRFLTYASQEYRDYILTNRIRRNVAINYKLTDNDLSASKLLWAKHDKKVDDICKKHYPLIKGLEENYETNEGVRIRLGHEVVLDTSLVTVEDEYYGMEVPTLVKVSNFHKIDNSNCEHDRIVGTVCFNPESIFEHIQPWIQHGTLFK
jgi:hypothetical protein